MEKMDIIEAECPSCSPDEPVDHKLLRVEDGRVKCEKCGHVHNLEVKREKPIKVRVIVSRGDKSSVQFVEVDKDEIVHFGDDFVVDMGEEVSGVRVQSIEANTGGRTEKAKASDIVTIWARAIDEVVVKIAIQRGWKTESVDFKVNGEYEFTIGDLMHIKEYEAVIKAIKIRDGGIFKRKGVIVKAKEIKRVYTNLVTQNRFRPREVGSGFRSSGRLSSGKREEGT
jgi:predicted Zn finger-like uncharacterized protein